MKTRQRYLDLVAAYIDGYADGPYVAEVHRAILMDLTDAHRSKLGEVIEAELPLPAEEMGKRLLQIATQMSDLPGPSILWRDPVVKERFVAAYTQFVYAQLSGQIFSEGLIAFDGGDEAFDATNKRSLN